MRSFGGQNTHVVKDTDPQVISNSLNALGIKDGHFNNGTFTLPKDVFAPAFLAAFKRVIDLKDGIDTPLIVAINSDISMIQSFKGKDNEAELVKTLISQEERAQNVISLLSGLFPNRSVVAVFYDEQTPHELYRGLSQNGFGMRSLHKVGYGTTPNEKPIVGAEFFEWVYACPLPHDAKPFMYNDTRDVNSNDRQPDVVEKLTEVIGPHGSPYLTKEGLPLFKLPTELAYLGVKKDRHPALRL